MIKVLCMRCGGYQPRVVKLFRTPHTVFRTTLCGTCKGVLLQEMKKNDRKVSVDLG